MSAPDQRPGVPRAREAIFTVAPYVGGESKVAGANRVVKLSSNEGAFGPPPGAIAAIAALAQDMHRYPDGGATALRSAIGRAFNLDPARIVCGNGSDELISLLIQSYGGPGTDLIMSAHGFLMYEISGKLAGMTVRKVPERHLTADIDAMLAAITPATRLVFLANPNNPTGSLLADTEVTRLRAGLPPDVLLVLDAAYAEYVEDAAYDPGIRLVDAGSNTVMTRTFSKIFGLGGARLGWAYAPPAIIDVLNRARGPFNVNALAAAGIAALNEPGWIARNRDHNCTARARLSERLTKAGLMIYPSHCNFILADFGAAARAAAADAHLRARGILVRAMTAYALESCLRITIGTDEECALTADALEDFLAHG
jgi:histidinol-phosphate aminotransferase